MIITSYDPEQDTFYVRFAPPGARSARMEAVTPQVTLDYDQDERLVAVEVLHVRQRLPSDDWRMLPEPAASH